MSAINLVRSAFSGLLRKSTYQTPVGQLSTVIQQSYNAKTAVKLYQVDQKNILQYQRNETYTSEYNADQENEICKRVMKVCKTFKKLSCADLTLNSHFMTDLGLKPLEHVEVLTAMEDEFDFEIPDSDVKLLVRPMDIIKYIAESDDDYE